jgi:CelD/BcsL family acetyltransferase involved in cellulose biosynthesis
VIHVNVIRPHELSEDHLTEWRRLQRLDPVLENPYLCPEFMRIAAEVRPGVVIAVGEECGRAAAFLPMQLRGDVAGPVGCPLSDCQAIIAAREWEGDPRDLIRAAGVSAYDFNYQRMQGPLAPYHRGAVFPSPVINLSNGFDAYVAVMRDRARNSVETSSGRPHQTMKRARRIERKVGPLHFTMHEADATALTTLLMWKRQQYQGSGRLLFSQRVPDIFSFGWTVELLERIHATQSENFAGILSTLHLGDRMVAAHMGMRSHNVLHWWFPAYDKSYASFSPGLILLLELCRSAATSGIREIELGPGDETYKGLVADSQIMLTSGFVGFASIPLWLRYFLYGTETLATRLPIGPPRTWPGRLFRRMDRMKWLRA